MKDDKVGYIRFVVEWHVVCNGVSCVASSHNSLSLKNITTCQCTVYNCSTTVPQTLAANAPLLGVERIQLTDAVNERIANDKSTSDIVAGISFVEDLECSAS